MTSNIGERTTLDELSGLAEIRAVERDEAVERSLDRVVQAGQELRLLLERPEMPPIEVARLVGSILNLTLEVCVKLGIDPAGGMTIALRK